MYCFTASISYGVEKYLPRLWGIDISDAIFQDLGLVVNLSKSELIPQQLCRILFRPLPGPGQAHAGEMASPDSQDKNSHALEHTVLGEDNTSAKFCLLSSVIVAR